MTHPNDDGFVSFKPMEYRYEQKAHCCSPLHSDLDCVGAATLTRADGGGGDYWVLSAHEVSFDDANDFRRFANQIIHAIDSQNERLYDIDEGDAETWKRRYEIANKRREDAVIERDMQATLATDRSIELTDIRTFVLLALKEQGISSPLTTKELIGELVNQRDMARQLAGGGK